MLRRAPMLAAILVVAAGIGIGAAASAQAAAYRYWTYWQGGTGTWAFATAGPASTVPADGSVVGWRFAVTSAAGSAAARPATAPDFAAICASTAPVAGSKRVALVIDPGPAAIAPAGQAPPAPVTACILAEPDATGYQVLRAAATVRTDNGLICAIGDYPVGECAPVVDDALAASTAANAQPEGQPIVDRAPEPPGGASGTPWLTAAVIAAAAVVGVVLWRRRAR